MKNLIFILGFLSPPLFAMPAQLVIIRHGEKPPVGNEVTTQGCERAFQLPGFFSSNRLVTQYGSPVAIYAQRPAGSMGSLRAIQTIAPTAQSAGLTINDSFESLDYKGIYQDISRSYAGKTVLIAWEHSAIPGLAEAFGAQLALKAQQWPDEVFDQAWILNLSGPAPTLEIVAEYVLPSDNPQGGLQHWADPPPFRGLGPPVPASVVQNCATNAVLNSLVKTLVNPPLP